MLSPYERILRSHKVLNDDETPLGPPWSPWPPWAPLGAPGPPAPPPGPPGCPRRAILCLELSQRKPVFGDVPDCLYALTDLQGLRGLRGRTGAPLGVGGFQCVYLCAALHAGARPGAAVAAAASAAGATRAAGMAGRRRCPRVLPLPRCLLLQNIYWILYVGVCVWRCSMTRRCCFPLTGLSDARIC